jgi:DNA-binding transcriptional regulator/RsmH inhibitor MraZ
VSNLLLHRLSPKNQVTLPRDARSLAALADGDVVCAMPRKALHEDPARRFPVVTLVTLPELRAREEKLRARYAGDEVTRFRKLQVFNEGIRQLAVDGQRRIVLPAHFVAHVGIGGDRDLYFSCSNDTIQLWNPTHYLAWKGETVDGSDSDLDALMF